MVSWKWVVTYGKDVFPPDNLLADLLYQTTVMGPSLLKLPQMFQDGHLQHLQEQVTEVEHGDSVPRETEFRTEILLQIILQIGIITLASVVFVPHFNSLQL
jgi:hypothetical protein